MVIGEGPGPDEARVGEPFVGKTGQEMRRYFDGDNLPPFDEVFRTNLYREYGGKDHEFTQDEITRDEPELLAELATVQPSILVAVGRHSTRWLLGDVGMDEVHGLPWYLPEDSKATRHLQSNKPLLDRVEIQGGACGIRSSNHDIIVFSVYHPAAGFRSPELSALVSYDFAQLALFVTQKITPRVLHDDPIPNPTYIRLDGSEQVERVLQTVFVPF